MQLKHITCRHIESERRDLFLQGGDGHVAFLLLVVISMILVSLVSSVLCTNNYKQQNNVLVQLSK